MNENSIKLGFQDEILSSIMSTIFLCDTLECGPLYLGLLQTNKNTKEVYECDNIKYQRKIITFVVDDETGNITNEKDITFVSDSDRWGNIDYIGIYTEDDKLLFLDRLSSTRTIESNGSLTFAKHSISFSISN